MSVSIFSFVPGIDDTTFMKCINNIPKDQRRILNDILGADYINQLLLNFQKK